MRRRTFVLVVWLMNLTTAQSANADVMCRWLGHCIYESPGFKIRVVDKETGKPLADVHAFAEWMQYGYQGTGGPLMAIDPVSGDDGVLTFRKWGPINGSSAGLVLDQDPVITLFKSGYVALTINNMPGTDERARVRGFNRADQTFKMEVFRGSTADWLQILKNIAYSPLGGSDSGKDAEQVRGAYRRRQQLIRTEATKITRDNDVDLLLDNLDRSMRLLEKDGGR